MSIPMTAYLPTIAAMAAVSGVLPMVGTDLPSPVELSTSRPRHRKRWMELLWRWMRRPVDNSGATIRTDLARSLRWWRGVGWSLAPTIRTLWRWTQTLVD